MPLWCFDDLASMWDALHGLCESNAWCAEVLQAEYASAHFAADFYEREWLRWPKDSAVRVLVGGASCTPYSAAGKQLGQGDDMSSQAADMAEMAAVLGVDIVIIENVVEILNARHVMSLIQIAFERQGFRLMVDHKVHHHRCGGWNDTSPCLLVV